MCTMKSRLRIGIERSRLGLEFETIFLCVILLVYVRFHRSLFGKYEHTASCLLDPLIVQDLEVPVFEREARVKYFVTFDDIRE